MPNNNAPPAHRNGPESHREIPMRGIRDYWYALEVPHTLCLFRILLGIHFLIGWLSVMPQVDFYYSSEGIALPAYPPPVGDASSPLDFLAVVIQPPPPWPLAKNRNPVMCLRQIQGEAVGFRFGNPALLEQRREKQPQRGSRSLRIRKGFHSNVPEVLDEHLLPRFGPKSEQARE